MLRTLVKQAQRSSVVLRQSYKRVSKRHLIGQSRYAHARQLKRATSQTKKLKTLLGRVVRDIERKYTEPDKQMKTLLKTAHRLLLQQRSDKNKLYQLHAPEVECIAKGKLHKRYEFGNKVSYATTSKDNWIVGALSYAGNPYDGHTLVESLRQITSLTDKHPRHVYCDQAYRGLK